MECCIFADPPGIIHLVLQPLYGRLDGVDLGDEALQGEVGAQLDVRTVGPVLQAGLGQLERALLGVDGQLQLADGVLLALDLILGLGSMDIVVGTVKN